MWRILGDHMISLPIVEASSTPSVFIHPENFYVVHCHCGVAPTQLCWWCVQQPCQGFAFRFAVWVRSSSSHKSTSLFQQRLGILWVFFKHQTKGFSDALWLLWSVVSQRNNRENQETQVQAHMYLELLLMFSWYKEYLKMLHIINFCCLTTDRSPAYAITTPEGPPANQFGFPFRSSTHKLLSTLQSPTCCPLLPRKDFQHFHQFLLPRLLN